MSATINADELIGLLGVSRADTKIGRVTKKLGECEVAEFDGNFDYCWYEHGFALMFERDRLDTIQFYPQGRDNYEEYPDALPHGLKFSFTEANVRKLLGKPSESLSHDTEDADIYKFPDHVLNVSYHKKPKTIALL